MPRKQNEVEKSLLKKGFKQGSGDHNYFFYHSIAGKKTSVFTKTSHGKKELDDFLLAQMSKQCKLSKTDFFDLVDCPLDRNAYEAKLIALNLVTAPPPPPPPPTAVAL